MLHCATVLSSRTDQFLPRLHDMWESTVSALRFGPDAVATTACLLLQHMSRYSGGFLRERFVQDAWPILKRDFRRCEGRIDGDPAFITRQHTPLTRLILAAVCLLRVLVKGQPDCFMQKVKVRVEHEKRSLIAEMREITFLEAVLESMAPLISAISRAAHQLESYGCRMIKSSIF